MNCKKCGKGLTYNEIGLNKKLTGRGQTSYFCKHCLAEYFGVSVQRLEEKERQYIRSGCSLFAE